MSQENYSRPRRGTAKWIAAALPAILLASLVVEAGTFTVTNTNDSGPGSLRQAIADALPGNTEDDILFDPLVTGTITLTSGPLRIAVPNPSYGFEIVNITGPGAEALTISGNGSSRVFELDGGSGTFTGLTISYGYSLNQGGAFHLDESSLRLEDSVVSGNNAFKEGGGFFVSDSSLTLTNSTVSGNSAFGEDSYCPSGCYYYTYNGGGIYARTDSEITIDSSVVAGNSATGSGGGISFDESMISLTNSTVSNNIAGASGGGIKQGFGNDTVTISSSTISGNISESNGGGIYLRGSANARLINSTVSGNTANDAAAKGGGIYTQDAYLSLFNSTVTGNTASEGGGIYNYWAAGTVTFTNALIATNTSSSGPDVYGPVNGGYNLIGNGTLMTGLADGVDGNQIGTAATPIGPGIDGLQVNGGPTKTHALQALSPAVDAGADCTAPPVNGVDQRGATRDSLCDIGAYEIAGLCPVLELMDDTVIAPISHEECEIRLGPNYAVAGGGDLSLTVGTAAVFQDGFSVLTGGLMSVSFDPGLQLRNLGSSQDSF